VAASPRPTEVYAQLAANMARRLDIVKLANQQPGCDVISGSIHRGDRVAAEHRDPSSALLQPAAGWLAQWLRPAAKRQRSDQIRWSRAR